MRGPRRVAPGAFIIASLPSGPSAAASTVSGEVPTAEAKSGPLAAEEPDRQQAGEQLRQRHGQPHAVHLQHPGQQKQPQQQEAEGAGKRDNGGGAPIGQGGKEGGGEDIYPGEEESGGEPSKAVQAMAYTWEPGVEKIPTTTPDRARATARIATDETRINRRQ